MPQVERTEVTVDAFDEPRPAQTDFDRIVERVMTRRSVLAGGVALGAGAFVLATAGLAPRTARAAAEMGFTPIAANTMDTITVPEGHSWHIVSMWGEPLWSNGAAFDEATGGTGESQELAFGDNNDGMEMFTSDGKTILAVNCEYPNGATLYNGRESKGPESEDDARKGKASVGVTICEIGQSDGKWSIVQDSPFNRRITADTPMEITGPARGHDLLKTAADPSGTQSLGTWNNCGSGQTPWGTFLTCEENFSDFFASSDEGFAPGPELSRYGVGPKDDGYGWAQFDERFDVGKNPNEPNRAGYIVEIDPLDPTSTPKKRTALGRFKHENAEVVVAPDGRVVVYLGDDERGEFLYKFVTDGKFAEGGDNSRLLDSGTLYVAKFGDDMRGEWVALTPETTGMNSQAEVAIHTRQAASAVGATTMDRPEWVSAHPSSPDAYVSLTNNKNRGLKPNAGGDDTPVGGPNPREANNYGQILRWTPDNSDPAATGFSWDLFVLAGNPTVHSDAYGGSANVTPDNMFNSPDGLAFDSTGRLWIQTDGNYSNEEDFAGMGNNQMLVGDPASGQIQRFLVGPKECEITGLTWSPDRKTLFVGIQHPGEKGNSNFPAGGSAIPRSSIIAITRDDGGELG